MTATALAATGHRPAQAGAGAPSPAWPYARCVAAPPSCSP
ncbi:hypothetical protein GA0070606_6444 [Micromonospora citrea]|uniref:Uncharacterized protein n=1 Tax=Micromonospora citrea TaxID=47855 RepID=A0A1C6W3U4_9ACTN|nr:hypothetical protein GA0070606_6444 [Micromonospora citrea]